MLTLSSGGSAGRPTDHDTSVANSNTSINTSMTSQSAQETSVIKTSV